LAGSFFFAQALAAGTSEVANGRTVVTHSPGALGYVGAVLVVLAPIATAVYLTHRGRTGAAAFVAG
jgi:hypothetical protein